MNYIISVCRPEAAAVFGDICSELCLPLSIKLYGRGTAVQSMLDILGIESTEKRVFITVANREKTKRLIKEQRNRMFIGVPGHGITVAVPIKSVGGGKTLEFLSGGNAEKYTPQMSYNYELIVAIANEGRTDLVMNAARAAGAAGGTVLHGKGTGGKEEKAFYNVSIADEKEVILIVSRAAQKSDIMRAIIENAGPSTEAGAIVFSLPASEVAGFGMFEDTSGEEK